MNEEIIIDETIKLLDENLRHKILNYILENPSEIIIGAAIIIIPIAILIKYKIDKITGGYNQSFKTTKYKQNFKKYRMMENEKLKPNKNKL